MMLNHGFKLLQDLTIPELNIHARLYRHVKSGAQLLSLLVLAWLGRRGNAWPAVRQRLGLHTGRGLFREIGAGVLTYLGMLPIVVVGVILTLLLQALGVPAGGHPAIDFLRQGPYALAGGIFEHTRDGMTHHETPPSNNQAAEDGLL